jgi:hypothetical protein
MSKKVTIEFDSADADDNLSMKRAIVADEMSIALWEIRELVIKRINGKIDDLTEDEFSKRILEEINSVNLLDIL